MENEYYLLEELVSNSARNLSNCKLPSPGDAEINSA